MAGAKPGVHVLQLKPVNVPKLLQEGEKFVKWDEDTNTGTPCTLKVDRNGFFLYWTYLSDQHDTDILDIATISDTRTNRSAKLPKDLRLREHLNFGGAEIGLEQKTLTVVHGSNFVDLSYTNFVHHKPEVVKVWCDEILKLAYNLLALNVCAMTYIRKIHTKLSILRDKNGKIPVKQIVKIFARHADDKKKVESALASSNLSFSKTDGISAEDFTWKAFLVFYNKLTMRIEAEHIFCKITNQPFSSETSGRLKPMTSAQFVNFLNEEQRDPRLNEILYPYADNNRAIELISLYEPSSDNDKKGVLSPEGFLNYLMSDENTVISLEKLDLYEDMTQPLSHYFINSSHNTYLTGHQFTGKSSVEMYRQALLAGCRCVELDFWNGRTEEPVIVHGYTLVPEISAKEVIEAISDSAFKTSDWPVILSFENHCNPKQQAKIAQYCRDFFSDMLLDIPLDAYPLEPGVMLPPPSALRRKIIIKNKKKHRVHRKGGQHAAITAVLSGEGSWTPNGGKEGPQNGGNPQLLKEISKDYPDDLDVVNGEIPESVVEDDGSSESEEDSSIEERRNSQRRDTSAAEEEAGAEISALVNYVQPVHFTSFDVSEKRNKGYEMSSFVETQALNLLKEHPTEFVNYNKRQISRVYPKGTRVDSSNFLPHQFWNAGCQLVALNYQTIDLPMQLNLGIFEHNARSGYLLKPDFMRRPDRRFDPFAESTVDGIIAGTLSVRVISGQFLSEKRSNCYVEVEMYGLPTDTVRKRFRTRTVPNNGMNPVWEEEPFVFKKVVLPEMATVRIAACEESSKSILGHRVLPLVGLRPGYKHISLRNERSQSLGLTTLFVHIKVGDYVPDGLSDFAEALANPIKYQNEIEKRSHQLEVFEDEEELGDTYSNNGAYPASPGPLTQSERSPKSPIEHSSSNQSSRKSETCINPLKGGETPPTKRQNSVCKKQSVSAKVSDERVPMPDAPPLALETVDLKADDLDTIWQQKPLKEKRKKVEKELKEAEQKFEKKRLSLLQEFEKAKIRLDKTHSKLVKKYSKSIESSSGLHRGFSEDQSVSPLMGSSPTGGYADREGRLTELKSSYRANLVKLHQEFFMQEKKIYEDSHEPMYNQLDKCLRASQTAQVKALQSLHNSGVEEMKKRQTEYHRDQIKFLTKSTSDKNELERKKREVCQDLVSRGTQDRQRLIEIFDRKKTDLENKHENMRQKFVQEKTKALENIQKTHNEKSLRVTTAPFDNL